jgi:hypothetical protein
MSRLVRINLIHAGGVALYFHHLTAVLTMSIAKVEFGDVEHAKCKIFHYGSGRIIVKIVCAMFAVAVARKLSEPTEKNISRIANIDDALSVAPISSNSNNVNISQPAIVGDARVASNAFLEPIDKDISKFVNIGDVLAVLAQRRVSKEMCICRLASSGYAATVFKRCLQPTNVRIVKFVVIGDVVIVQESFFEPKRFPINRAVTS